MSEPTYGNGKICYLEIPTEDINRSKQFYEAVFGSPFGNELLFAWTGTDGVPQVQTAVARLQ